ncbi:hypothetical protein [Neptunicella sp. SCSIO 80796]|uniref:hypothetical protein n=1 Tax=Neptunicella plasticusilytica TaxID=3117012 RepID=UPI003A4E3965
MNNTIHTRQPELSFCIPVKNRFADIQATLRQNLEDNREDEAQIEFILICFDDYHYMHADDDNNHNVQRWVELNFADDLASGYLRFYHLSGLPQWHFGKAKNAFKPYIKGKIYASLDGDNFTGKHAGRHIINVFRHHQYQCVLHQFQGDYGDGTCGRIALKREHYLDWGYDENFLPRQWDELDAILTTLVNQPDATYICYVGQGKNILQRSYPIRRFMKDHDREFRQQEIADPGLFDHSGQQQVAAVGQHDSEYVAQDINMRLASIYNNHLSLMKNSDRAELKYRYEQELINCQRNMLQNIEPERLQQWFLNTLSTSPYLNDPREGNTLLFGWIDHNKMDHSTFQAWHKHHSDLGVETFFLVVDPAARFTGFDTSLFPDVQLMEPAVTLPADAVGNCMFLLEILLKVYGQGKQCYLLGEDPWVPVDLNRLTMPQGKNITGAILSHDKLVNPLLDNHLCEYVKTGKAEKKQSSYRLVNKANHLIQQILSDLEELAERSISRLKNSKLNYNGPILLNWQPDMSLASDKGKLLVKAKQQKYSYVRFSGARE